VEESSDIGENIALREDNARIKNNAVSPERKNPKSGEITLTYLVTLLLSSIFLN
jgi:hypothetical protein